MQAELLQARAHESDAHIARLEQERDAGRFTSKKSTNTGAFTSTKVQMRTHIARLAQERDAGTSTKVQMLAYLLVQKYKYRRAPHTRARRRQPATSTDRVLKFKYWRIYEYKSTERDAASQQLAQTARAHDEQVY